MKRLTPEQPLHRCLTAFLVVVSLVPSPLLQANPTGEVVIDGDVQFDRSAGQLRVLQASDRAIIDWESFSIGAGQLTEFVQPNSSSAALNRVRGASASQIEGMLRANGKVYLLNPNGILIGPNGSIDVAGFAGSTLDVSDEQFRNGGDLNFSGASQAAIVNLGSISALEGDVILIAASVSNEGTIKAPRGTAALAAGNDVLLAESGSERVFVRGASGGNKAVGVNNSGAIEANIAELKSYGGNIYGMAVKNEGRVAATGVTRQGGQIFLSSKGGRIRSTGTVKARKSDGSGGNVKIDSGADNSTELGGTIDASGQTGKGGEIVILGREIEVFDGTLVLNDGETGGGNTFVGGGLRGQDPEFMNAENVSVGSGASISANARSSGNGGRVVFFAEGTLEFGGEVSVQGGAVGGDGGFVELSGKKLVRIPSLSRQVHLAAPNGRGGTLLLDPTNVVIKAGTAPLVGGASADTILYADDISAILGSGDFTIETDSPGIAAGDITVEKDAGISWSSGNSLTLQAHRDISLLGDGTLGASITATGGGSFSAVAGRSIILGSASSIKTASGNLNLEANLAGTATGSFSGVNLNNAIIEITGSGDLTVRGKGGNDTLGSQIGVRVSNGGDIIGGTGGLLTIEGNGGTNGGSNNFGVLVVDAGSSISSSGGNVSVTGTGGGGTANQNMGVRVSAGIISAGGTGTVTVTGTGGGTAAGQHIGVQVFNSGKITSSGGNVSVTGTGGTGSGGFSHGVLLNNGEISATLLGTVSVTGTGGSGGTDNYGVRLEGSSPLVSSNNRNISVTSDSISMGIGSIGAFSINSGTGTTTINTRTAGTLIDLGGADVLAGSSLGLTDTELDLINAGTLQIGNSSSAAIVVSSAISIGNNLSFTSGASVSGAGDLTLAAGKNFSVTANGLIGFSGVITVPGTTSFNSGAFGMTVNNAANNFGGAISLANSGTNAVQIRDTDSLVLGTVNLGGDLTLTANGNITQIGAITSGGTTTLRAGETNNITLTNASNNFSSVSIATGNDVALTDVNALTLSYSSVSGTFDVTAAGITVAGFLALRGDTTFNSTGGITVNQSINMATDKNFVATASGLIDFSTVNAELSTFGTGEISLTTNRNINLSSGSSIIVEHGDLTLSANAAGAETGTFSGITVGNGALIRSLGTGGISLTGKGGLAPTGDDLRGVEIAGTIRSASGAIEVSGTGGGGTTGERHNGIRLESTGLIESTGTGSGAATITLTGLAGSGSLNEQGIALLGAISSIDGNISITGTGGASVGNNNKGILLFGSGSITSTGTGANAADITLTGYGSTLQAGDFSDGIGLPGGSITSVDGDITLSGTSYLGNNVGIRTGTMTNSTTVSSSGSGAITITAIGSPTATLEDFFSQGSSTFVSSIGSATGTGGITLNADTVDLIFVTLANAGDLRIRPTGFGVSMGLGGETGTLNLNAAELANLSDGFSSIQFGNELTGQIRIASSTFHDPVSFLSGTNIHVNGQLTGEDEATFTFETVSTSTTYLNASIVTDGSTVSIIDDVVLGADVTINTTNGAPNAAGANVTISGTVSGAGTARNLSITAGTGGAIEIGGSVGSEELIGNISLSGGTVDLNAVTSQGNIEIFANSLALGGNVSGSGSLTIASRTFATIGIGSDASGTLHLDDDEVGRLQDGFSSITIGNFNAGDISIEAATFRDPVSFFGADNIFINGQLTGEDDASFSFETESTETTYLNANIVTSGSAITILDDVVLGADVLLDTTNGFPNSAGANVSISGAVSGSESVTNLSVTAGTAGTIEISSSIGDDGTIGDISLSGGTVDLNAMTSQGNIEIFANSLTLGGNVSGSGILTIASHTFATIGIGSDASGTLHLDDDEVGRLQDGFSSITIGNFNAGDIDIEAATFKDPVSFFGANNIFVNGQLTGEDDASFSFETESTETTYLNANIVTSGTAVSIVDDVVLGADILIDTTNGNMNAGGANVGISGTVSGSGSVRNFSITSGTAGTIEIEGAIGDDNLIGNISLSGAGANLDAMTSQGNIEVFVDAIELAGNLSGSGTLKLAPLSSGTTIGIGSAAEGDFYLNTTEVSYLQNGFASITIGSSTSGDIEIEQSEFFDPLEVIGAGNIDIIGELTGDADITLTADNITVDAPVNSTAGNLVFNLNNQGPSAGGTIAINSNLYYDAGVEFNGGDGTEDLVTYAGFAGPVEFSLNNLSAIEFLIGSGDMDELFGPALGSEYTFTGTDSFSVAGVAVSAFENVTAGADEDTFIFGDGTGLTGTLSGGGPSNQLRFSAFTSAVGIDFENLTASFLGGGFTEINHFVGNGANATFTGQNAATTYTVTGENDFEFGTVPDKVTVTDFANLTGGDGADSFNFKTAGVFTGTLDGGGDSNTIDFATENFGFPASINFETKSGSGFSGGGAFSHIAHFIGQGEGYTFIGQNTATDYTVTGENDFEFDVYPDTFTVTDFANLTGGLNNDTFSFGAGSSLSGTLDGGSGGNTLDYSSYGAAVTVNIGAGSATGLGGFSNVTDFVGSPSQDTLHGTTGSDVVNITSNNSGTINGANTFASFEILNAGSGNDFFNFLNQATVSLVDGGANFDTLFLDDSNLTGDHTYTITSNSITRNPVYNFINIEHLNLLAGEGDDTINSGFFPFSQTLDSGLGFNTLNLPGVTNLDGTTQIQNVSHLRFAAPRTLQSNPGDGNTPPPPAEFVAQNRFNSGNMDQMMQQLMGNQGGFSATTIIGQGVIVAVEGNSYLIFRAISLDGSGLTPSEAATAALSDNLSVDANVELAGAIGYTGIVLLFMRDGAYAIDLSGAVVDPAVLALLKANLSTPAALELFAALQMPFLFTIIDADGAVAISFDGNAPGQVVILLLAEQLSDAAFNELNAAIAGGN